MRLILDSHVSNGTAVPSKILSSTSFPLSFPKISPSEQRSDFLYIEYLCQVESEQYDFELNFDNLDLPTIEFVAKCFYRVNLMPFDVNNTKKIFVNTMVNAKIMSFNALH